MNVAFGAVRIPSVVDGLPTLKLVESRSFACETWDHGHVARDTAKHTTRDAASDAQRDAERDQANPSTTSVAISQGCEAS